MGSHDADFYAWTRVQADALRELRPNHLDWANIAEELEAMGRSERAQLESRVRLILMHLQKWRYQPWMRTRSWRTTLLVQRRDLEKHLRRNPSLRPLLSDVIEEEYAQAALIAGDKTGLSEAAFPATCPFDAGQVLDPDYLPNA
ncbi:MAG: DUF29 domain-containing protein [Rubrobacteraceae bacterium]